MRRAPVAIVLALGLALGACGKGDPSVERAEARTIGALDADGVPGTMRGLTVEREDIEDTFESAKRPYIDGVVLFSLRDGERLMATLQIARFADDAKWKTSRFRSSLLATIGGGKPRELRMDDQQVYITAGDRQGLAVWFKDQHMFVLSTREDYDFPRGLLRDATALEVEG
jgi:hypothetical protein